MRLHVVEHGEGDRTAILIHGFSDDHGTWWRVWPELVAKGYRVLMPDLRGHGKSPRADVYGFEQWAQDLVESLPKNADVVMGHSLGGRLLGLAVAELTPERAVYLDPAWEIPEGFGDDALPYLEQVKHFTAADIQKMQPRWSERDIEAELSSFAALDLATAQALTSAGDAVPGLVVPSMVVLADGSQLVSPTLRERLEKEGFAFRTVTGAGHVMHRDDFGGFMAALDGWI